MPEGDTVWRTARHLDQALSGRVLIASDVRVPAFATVDLSGRTVRETVARGKHLLTRIGDDAAAVTVHTHLKMEGAWHLYRPGSRWQRPAHQARIVLRTEEWIGVGFSLGIVEIVPTAEEHAAVGHLGPDLLGPDWDLEEALRRLVAAPQRDIADALLDQRIVAGIGNLYKNELCFLRGIHPRCRVEDVSDRAGLLLRAKQLLEANKLRVEQTTTGDLQTGRRHWVYRRAGEPCRRCETPIEVDMQGPTTQEHATYWCPRCQPASDSLQVTIRFEPVHEHPDHMTAAALSFRAAGLPDVEAIVALVNSAYRGDGSKRGWTTEADLLDGARTDATEIASLIQREDSTILLAERGGALIGTVLLQHKAGSAYLGMLVIDPSRQAAGLGKQLMLAAEALVQERWGATRIWMTVLIQRSELIAFYERRGYRRTGKLEPWPTEYSSVPKVDGLMFEVLEKSLG